MRVTMATHGGGNRYIAEYPHFRVLVEVVIVR